MDFTDLNAVSEMDHYVIPDPTTVRDLFAHSDVFSTMDLKSGFYNVPVAEDTVPLLGMVTPDGLYVWARMPMGAKGAPFHFQFVVDGVLSAEPQLSTVAYLDDLTPHGRGW